MPFGQSRQDAINPSAKECVAAIEIATSSAELRRIDLTKYKLIAARNLIAEAGASVWQLTFKPNRLIPPNSGTRIGAGGEVFVQVDTRRKTVEVRFGE